VSAGDTESGLPFGVTWIAPRDRDLALIQAASQGPATAMVSETLSLLLFGAHMKGLPLNTQVQALGGQYVGPVQTASKYQMVYLPEPAPHRPGIIRVGEGGTGICAEEWVFPKSALGELLSTIQQPLGLGQIELSDGRKVHGFLCEASAAEGAQDISKYGSWRAFLDQLT